MFVVYDHSLDLSSKGMNENSHLGHPTPFTRRDLPRIIRISSSIECTVNKRLNGSSRGVFFLKITPRLKLPLFVDSDVLLSV